jgi:hypothetical protein
MSRLRMLMRSMERCWCTSSLSPFPLAIHFPIPSLSSSRVPPCSWELERGRGLQMNQWGRGWVRGCALADNRSQLMNMWVQVHKWKTTYIHLTLCYLSFYRRIRYPGGSFGSLCLVLNWLSHWIMYANR